MLQKGDKVNVFVSVVEPRGKVCRFWGQTDTPKCQMIEALMEEASAELSATNNPVSLNTVEVGDVFLAKFHEDQRWYRAKVKAVDKTTEKVTVFFLDYGNEEVVGVAEIAKGHGKHFEIPPQASQFILGDVQAADNREWTEAEINGLKEQLVYGEFQGIVLNGGTVGNPPTVRLLKEDNSQETVVTTLIAAGYGTRSSIGMEPPLHQTILEPKQSYHVYVVYYESPLNFWIQLVERESVLTDLQESIGSEITDSSECVARVALGTVCIAKFRDAESDFETYYRAVVTNILPNKQCTVLYVDYGNSETLNLTEVKVMPTRFRQLPSQAIQCCLHGSLSDAADFQRMLESEHIYANVASVMDSGLHVVQLTEGQSSATQQEVSPEPIQIASHHSQQQVSQNRLSNQSMGLRSSFKPLQFNVGKHIDLCISHVEPSGKFYCQLLENGPRLNQLMILLHERARTGTPMNIISQGTPCLTKSALDKDVVYRSKIVSQPHPQSVRVHHVDFGLSEDVSLSNVLFIDEDLLELPAQAIYCSLSGADNFDPEAVSNVLRRYESQTALVGGVVLKSGQLYEMDLVDTSGIEDKYIVQELQSNSSPSRNVCEAYKKVALKAGQWTDVQVMFVDNPDRVFCQFVSSQEELGALMEKMEAHCASGRATSLSHPEPGTPCLARFSDGVWYRATVTGMQSSGVEVFFVDYGNHDIVTQDNLRAIPPDFLLLPMQCFRGMLDGLVSQPGSWTEQDTTILFDMASEESHPTIIVRYESQEDFYMVQLFTSSGLNVNEKFGQTTQKLSPKFRNCGPPPSVGGHKASSVNPVSSRNGTPQTVSGPTSPTENTQGWAKWQQTSAQQIEIKPTEVEPGYKDITIETIVTPGEFYSRLTENDEVLRVFMDHINEDYGRLAPEELLLTNPAEGMMCAAKFNGDWYRARIVSVSRQSVHVRYIDYGHTQIVPLEEVKQLKPSHTKLPAQAVKCALTGVAPAGGTWSDESIQIFEEIVGDTSSVGAFTECGQDGTYLIEVIQTIPGGQILVHEELLKRGVAISLEPKVPNVDQVLLRGSRSARPLSSSSASSCGSQSVQASLKYTKPAIAVGQRVDVNVVHVETPNEFWVQLTEKCAELESLMGTLQDYYSALGPDQCRLPSVKQDMTCIARFSEDEMWYRAEVVRVLRSEVMVRYVDYGNYEKRSTADVWEMRPEFMALPAQAIQCSLHGVVAPPTGWAATTKDTVEDLVLDKNLLAEVMSVSQSQGLSVRLVEIGEHGRKVIADVLVGMRLAIQNPQRDATTRQVGRNSPRTSSLNTTPAPSPPRATVNPMPAPAAPVKKDMPPQDIAMGDDMKVNIVWANSPTSFYCQRLESQGVLNKMMAAINEHYETMRMKESELRDPQPGQICVALYDADGNWYRSRVLRTRNREAEVLYVDYGNKDRLSWSKLKVIKPQFLDVPQLAIHCMLQDMEVYGGNYSVGVERYFQALMKEDLSMKVLALPPTPGAPHAVSITDTRGADVASKIVHLEGGQQKSGKQDIQSPPRQEPRAKQEVRAPPRNDISQQRSERSTRTPPRTERAPEVTLKMLNTPLRPGNDISLIVSNIESITFFYCQLSANTAGLDSFMETLEAHYSSGKERPITASQVKPGMPCAAQFSEDNFWYRASVKRVVSPKEVEVLFVDYGNSEVTTLQKVCPLLAKFADYPTQAFPCGLSGVTLSKNDALVHFRQLVEGKELAGKVITNKGSSVQVELTDPATKVNINAEILSKFGGSEVSNDAPMTYPLPKVPTGEGVEVYIAHVDSPGSFWVQPTAQEAEVESFATSMLYKFDSLGPDEQKLQRVVLSGPCVARYSEDQAWYRGTIEKIEGDSVTVRFIDYGNTDTVNSSELKSVSPEFVKVPPFAIHCKLAGVVEPPSGWTADQKATLEGLETSLTATFSGTGTPAPVKLFADGADVAQQIGPVQEISPVTSRRAEYPVATIPTSAVPVYASHIEDGFIYVQLVDQSDVLQSVTEQLQEVYEALPPEGMALKDVQEGTACCTKFSEDEAWYRANITNVSGKAVSVHFVDFGNSEIQIGAPLKLLTPDLLQYPPFAYKCQLQGLSRPDGGWPEGFMGALEEHLMDCQIIATFVSAQEPYIVKMVVEDQDVSAQIQAQLSVGESQVPTQTTPESLTQSVNEPPQQSLEVPKFPLQSIPSGETTAFMSHLEGPDGIYMQLESDTDMLQEVTDSLQAVYTALGPAELAVTSPQQGMACCAKFSEDEAWYRAVVEAQTNQGIQVRFVDFGNTELTTCDSLKQLKPDLLQRPAFAFRCKLDGLAGQADDKTEKLVEVLTDQEIKTVFVTNTTPFCVKMSVGGEDVRNTLLAGVSGTEGEQQTSDISEADQNAGETQAESPSENLELPSQRIVVPQDKISITAIDSPSKFYVQIESELDALEEFMEHVSKVCETESPLDDCSVGQLCCAKYSEDGAWYRAVITKIDETITVRFVDYGNYDTVEPSNILPLPAKLAGRAAFASTYQLVGASGKTWTEDQIEQFTELTMHKDIVVKEVHSESTPPAICISEGDVDINKVMGISAQVKSSPESEEEFLEVSEDVGSSNTQDPTTQDPTTQEVPSKQPAAGAEDQSSEASEEFTDAVDEVGQDELLLKPGSRVEVEVQHIKSPSQFWCHLVRCKEEREETLESVAEFCEKATASEDVEIGKIYGARYIDGEWCRVTIREIGDEQVSAFYIDYGSTDKVYKNDLRLLPHSLVKAPAFALPCLLSGVKPLESKWSEKANLCFEELVSGTTLLAEVVGVEKMKEEVVYVVQLLNMGIMVSQKMVQMGHAEESDDIVCEREEDTAEEQTLKTDPQSPEKGEEYTYRDLDQAKSTLFFGADDSDETSDAEPDMTELPESHLNKGERVEVLISHVKTFSSIFVQLKTKQAGIETMLDELQEAYDSSACDTNQEFQLTIKTGLLCAALSSEDELWYRAIVLNAMDGEATVQFVDYGNTETLETEHLRPLKPKFSTDPKQAIKCRLHGAEDVSEDVFETFVVEVQDKTLLAEVVEISEDSAPSLKLLDMGSCVPSRLTTSDEQETTEQSQTTALTQEEPSREETEGITEKGDGDHAHIKDGTEETDSQILPDCENPPKTVDIELNMEGVNTNNNAVCEEARTEVTDDKFEEEIIENNNLTCGIIKNTTACQDEDETEDLQIDDKDTTEMSGSDEVSDNKSSTENIRTSDTDSALLPGTNETVLPAESSGEKEDKCVIDQQRPEGFIQQQEAQTASDQTDDQGDGSGEGVLDDVEEGLEKRVEEITDEQEHSEEHPVQESVTMDASNDDGALEESEDSSDIQQQNKSVEEDTDSSSEKLNEIKIQEQEDVDENYQEDANEKPQEELDESPQDDTDTNPQEDTDTKSQDGGNENSTADTDANSIEEEETDEKEPEDIPVNDVVTDSTLISDAESQNVIDVDVIETKDQASNAVRGEESDASLSESITKNEPDQGAPELDEDEEESTKCEDLMLFSHPCLLEGENLNVTTSVTNSPLDFWCQLIKPSTTDLPLLSDRIQYYCSGEPAADTTLKDPTVGTPCFARCSMDGNWYRGKVMSLSGDSAEVRYVDYGNSESAKISDLRRLSPEFLELNAQAFKCCLDGVACNEGSQWDETSCARFEELVTDKELVLNIKSKTRSSSDDIDEVLNVTLQDGETSIAKVLIEGGYAQAYKCCSSKEDDKVHSHGLSLVPLEPESVVEVKYCEGVSPDNFNLQLQDGVEEMTNILANLADVDIGGNVDVAVGQPVLVDSRRAVIRQIMDSQCTVDLVDEGRTETVTIDSLRPLPEKAHHPPPLGLHCRLAGVEAEAWTEEALSCFKDLVASSTLSARVSAVEGTTHLVYLYDLSDPSGQSINSQLVSRGHAWMAPDTELDLDCTNQETLAEHQDQLESSFLEMNQERRQSLGALGDLDYLNDDEVEVDTIEVLTYSAPLLAVGEEAEMLCLSAKDPDSLVCRLSSDGPEYEAMVTALNDTNQTGEEEPVDASHLHSGDACLAYSTRAHSWQRARLLTKEGDQLGVHYVDVGDGETVPLTNVRPITPTSLRLSAQAVTCRLAGVTPTTDNWTEDAVSALSSTVVGKTLTVRVHEIEVDGQLVVNISTSDEEDVADMLIRSGHARREEMGTPEYAADLQEDRSEEALCTQTDVTSDESADNCDGATSTKTSVQNEEK